MPNWKKLIASGSDASLNSLNVKGTITANAFSGNFQGSIANNLVSANQLNVTGNGTTSQYLRSDGDGSFTWATPPNTTYSVGNGGLTEINFTSTLNTKLAGIAASANNYSLPEATATTRGGIELFSNTDNPTAANAVSSTTGRTYGIQLNSAGQAVVNVPWVDTNTNTTYTAGTGLTLVGTEFRNAAPDQTVSLTGKGATTVSGTYPNFTITSTDTNTNTTYSAGTGLTLTGTTFSLTNTYDNYDSWTIGDGINTEKIGSGATLTIRGAGASVTSYDAASNTLTITSTDTNTDTNTTYSAGSGLSLSGTTFSHSDTSTQGSVNNSGRTYIQDITLDTYGHITGIVSATETVVNTDTNTVTKIGTEAVDKAPGDFTFIGKGATTITQEGGNIYVSSTDTDTNTTYSVGDGGLTQKNFTTTLFNKLNGIAASANNYSLPEATSTVRGGIELFNDTDQAVAANTVSATAGRTYGIQLNSAGQAVVNVPWVDTNTNTTYSAGTGLTLSGTTFSLTTPITNNNQLTNGAGYQTAAQVNTAIQGVVDSAPDALNTLNELAAALGDDANFAGTVTTALAGKLSTTGKAADSNLLDGLDLGGTTANVANKVVRTDANGYLNTGWINTTSGNTTSTITDFFVNTNDGYIRKATKAHVQSQLGLGSAAYVNTSAFDSAGTGAAEAAKVNTRIDEAVLPAIPTNNNQLTNGAGYITSYVNTQRSDEEIRDVAAAQWINGTNTTVVKDDTNNTIKINSVNTNTTYSAGTGISLSGTTFSNAAPDQTVSLTGKGATTVSGTYPNFTITSTDTNTDTNTTYSAGTGISLSGTTFSNSAPDQTVTLTGKGATTISGTYPNFTITSTDTDTDTNTWRPVDDTPRDGQTGVSISSNWAFDNVKTAVPANAKFTDTNTQLTDAQVRSKFSAGTNVSISAAGVISATDTNTTYSVGNGGLTEINFTSALNTKLAGIAASANNYSHPGYTARSIDTSGAAVLDVFTSDTAGHVTNITTRNLTLADLGYTGATNANYITNNNQLSNGAGYLTSTNDRVYLTDSRGGVRLPSFYDDRYAQWDFQSSADTEAGGDGWHAIQTISKWTAFDATHRQEQLIFTGDNLKRRTATSDTKWGELKTVWDSGNLNPVVSATVSNDTTTFTKADGSTFALTTSDANSNTVTSVGISGDLSTGNITLVGTGATSITKSGGTITINSTDTNTNTTYSAGSGITLSGTTFSNAAPDQTVSLTGKGATTVSGTYPNFTITSTDTNTDTNTTYSAGGGLTLSGTTFSHTDTSSQGSVNNSGRTYIQDITLDTYGHITGITSATETVVNTDTDTVTKIGTEGVGPAPGEFTFVGKGATSIFQEGGKIYVSSTDTNTDTNTTYSAGSGLSLSGTTFSVQNDLRGEAWLIGPSTSDYINVTDTYIDFVLDGAVDMRLYNNGTLHVEGDVIAYSTTISDERLKDDVTTIQNPLDKIKALRGVEYIWNAGSRRGKRDLGLIAQEVEMVIPEIVHDHELPLIDGESGTVYKTVDYEKMVAVLIEGMKEQQSQIDELKSEISKLKGEA
jgi:hypothetical protein